MSNKLRYSFYSMAWLFLLSLNNLVIAIDVKKTQTTTSWDNKTDWGLVWTLDKLLGYLIGLLYFIAVVYSLYGWFQILTAWWDEDKVKKWKTTLINGVIGLLVIFLASQIVTWIIGVWNTVL